MQCPDSQKVIDFKSQGGSEPGHEFRGNQFVTVPSEEVFVHEKPSEGEKETVNFTVKEALADPQKLIDHNQESADKVAKLISGNWQSTGSKKKKKAGGKT